MGDVVGMRPAPVIPTGALIVVTVSADDVPILQLPVNGSAEAVFPGAVDRQPALEALEAAIDALKVSS